MTQESLPGTTDRRLAGLLTLLAENATVVTSGTRIAKEVGVSRSMVWQWVERLRELGVKAKGQPATGYFLEQVPDILTPDMLKQRLKGSLFGKRIFHFFKTDSTNRVAFELGHAGEPEGAVVLAEEQTAGRGRAGRTWHSERAAGVYLTLLLRPKLAPVQAPLLTMMAGLSAHTAVEAVTGLAVDLKWPNDLIIRPLQVHCEPGDGLYCRMRRKTRHHRQQRGLHWRQLWTQQQRQVNSCGSLGVPSPSRAASSRRLLFCKNDGP